MKPGFFFLLQQEFLGHWNFWDSEYSYNIYDNGANEISTMNILGNDIMCNFREFDYIISVHFIRYMFTSQLSNIHLTLNND